MEIRISKEIREYNEHIFFGLTMRQCLFAALAAGVAIICYFTLSPYLSLEPLSWICMIAAVPFVLLGFVRYHGMYFEDFTRCFLKSYLLSMKPLVYKSENMYELMLIESAKEKRREEKHRYVKGFKKNKKSK